MSEKDEVSSSAIEPGMFSFDDLRVETETKPIPNPEQPFGAFSSSEPHMGSLLGPSLETHFAKVLSSHALSKFNSVQFGNPSFIPDPRALLSDSIDTEAPLQSVNAASPPVFRIVLTGGPCAGKSTGMDTVAERLRSRGFQVLMVPEAATLLFSGGIAFSMIASDSQCIQFQAALLKTQMTLEDAFVNVARGTGRASVVLCDRGTMDGRAYMSEDLWKQMMDTFKWDATKLRDDRYDAVLHLVTAAEGKPSFYSLANNKSRSETPEQAIDLDHRLRAAWLGHRSLRVIDNSTGFQEKMMRVVRAVAQVVGLPHASEELRKKFLVSNLNENALLEVKNLQRFDVEQTVLAVRQGLAHDGEPDMTDARSGGAQEWVRKRSEKGAVHYSHTIRKAHRSGMSRVEIKRHLTPKEYDALIEFADPTLAPLRIHRSCFLVGDRVFVLDEMRDLNVTLLRAQFEPEMLSKDILPPFIESAVDVSNDSSFGIAALARRAFIELESGKQS
mmetsp:Transcript_1352/g.2466  ORF Transcript_1352/g.2466 Transcript_1352/m.2466 type:complete len:501 (-) Transcript_1352:979-2481(-)